MVGCSLESWEYFSTIIFPCDENGLIFDLKYKTQWPHYGLLKKRDILLHQKLFSLVNPGISLRNMSENLNNIKPTTFCNKNDKVYFLPNKMPLSENFNGNTKRGEDHASVFVSKKGKTIWNLSEEWKPFFLLLRSQNNYMSFLWIQHIYPIPKWKYERRKHAILQREQKHGLWKE